MNDQQQGRSDHVTIKQEREAKYSLQTTTHTFINKFYALLKNFRSNAVF